MLIRTHLAIAAFFIILFFNHVNSKIVFVVMVIAATFLPDIDCAASTLGQHKIFRFLQFFVKHRGMIHSFSMAFLISLILAVVWPVASLGFFLGYGIHLFGDSFTKEGIQPFWPYSKKSYGFITTGGRMEITVFVIFIIVDLLSLIFSFI